MKNRRTKAQYPGLDKNLNLKNRQENIDFDYLHKLSEDELKWLNSFMEEYNGANFNHKGKKIHKTKAGEKACYDSNNRRNRDVYSIAKTNDMLKELNNKIDKGRKINSIDIEDRLIAKIDLDSLKKT